MTQKSWRNRAVMGGAIGAAAIAVVLDHTRHPLPEPEPAVVVVDLGAAVADVGDDGTAVAIVPCGLDGPARATGGAPCSLGGSPCSLNSSPCSL